MGLITYKERLNHYRRWALMEGSLHFDKDNSVHKTLRAVVKRLDVIGVPYAVVGGMALFHHGFRRFTEDVHLLVTRVNLKLIHEKLEGLGYVPPFTGSKHLRDTDTGVKVEFLTTGDYPGDGKPKSVSFPDPVDCYVEDDGIKYLTLTKLIELEFVSGISNIMRGKDIFDVQALMQELLLDESLADDHDPYVRTKYLEMVQMIRDNPTIQE